ncbi:unnamed protein product [Didymodactylos carnosus]|uniref:Uncharacterized protein n=1 Tax=Didymodactylos carnosus TaxID=1234261 RepID=A0A814DMC4_9BILA|nr:unnamed protein product [Didymodactylos carnosus]CAF1287334.1 unnamed protein product [Didymodactylos carnosus]CAF3731774.1 unnamed protein product [Didymodactylos carnosus]CAF4092330.1 unnamed protein product [Didymodactylos carnosus]
MNRLQLNRLIIPLSRIKQHGYISDANQSTAPVKKEPEKLEVSVDEKTPKVGYLTPCDWEDALSVVAEKLGRSTGSKMAALAGRFCDAEGLIALKLFQRQDRTSIYTAVVSLANKLRLS